MPLPGRLPNHKADKSLLLPSNCSKSGMYVHARERKLFHGQNFVHSGVILTQIDTMKPASDLCFECQINTRFILQSANMSEEDKFQLKAAEAHLTLATLQCTVQKRPKLSGKSITRVYKLPTQEQCTTALITPKT